MFELKHIPLSLLVLNSLKILTLGANPTDIGVLAVLSAVTAFYEFKTDKKVIDSLNKELETHKLAIENIAKQMVELKTYITGIKMNQSIAGQRVGNEKARITF